MKPTMEDHHVVLPKQVEDGCKKHRMIKVNLYDSFRLFETTSRFLAQLPKYGWKDETEDVILDIGCGTAASTSNLIRPLFPNFKKLIGIDIEPAAIQIAKSKYSYPSIEYHVADIESSETGSYWKGQATKILSLFCFNWLSDQKMGFKNVYEILQPGGQAAFLFVLKSPLYDATLELSKSSKWGLHLKNVECTIPASHFDTLGSKYYKSQLESVGFQVILSQEEDVENLLTTREESENFFFSICTVANQIPEIMEKDFKQDLYESIKKHLKCDTEPMQSWIKKDLKLIVKKI